MRVYKYSTQMNLVNSLIGFAMITIMTITVKLIICP